MIDTTLPIRRFLDRQSRTVLGMVGAWVDVGEFGWERWERELVVDLLRNGLERADAEKVAKALNRLIAADCHRVYAAYLPKAERLASIRDMYADLGGRVAGLIGSLINPASVSLDAKQMLYKLFDRYGQLLYVGITDRGPTRLVEHYRHKEWFPRVERVEFERYQTREEVLKREEDAIKTLHPIFNVIHNQVRRVAHQ